MSAQKGEGVNIRVTQIRGQSVDTVFQTEEGREG